MSRRKSRRRSERRRGLVVTEGIVTEPQYLALLKQKMPRDIAFFDVCPEGTDPLRVVKRAVNKQKMSDYDWIVCLVDCDEHRTFDEAFKLAEKHGIQVLVSNPCFEVWLLWHIEDFNRHSEARDVQARLKGLKVTRGKKLLASFQVEKYREACSRARRADRRPTANRIGPNPSSGLPVLLELLEGITPRNEG